MARTLGICFAITYIISYHIHIIHHGAHLGHLLPDLLAAVHGAQEHPLLLRRHPLVQDALHARGTTRAGVSIGESTHQVPRHPLAELLAANQCHASCAVPRRAACFTPVLLQRDLHQTTPPTCSPDVAMTSACVYAQLHTCAREHISSPHPPAAPPACGPSSRCAPGRARPQGCSAWPGEGVRQGQKSDRGVQADQCTSAERPCARLELTLRCRGTCALVTGGSGALQGAWMGDADASLRKKKRACGVSTRLPAP
jgi:hypothetical protein